MKSDKEIRELIKKLDKNELIEELSNEGFIEYSEKAGHWLDCLKWVSEDDK